MSDTDNDAEEITIKNYGVRTSSQQREKLNLLLICKNVIPMIHIKNVLKCGWGAPLAES